MKTLRFARRHCAHPESGVPWLETSSTEAIAADTILLVPPFTLQHMSGAVACQRCSAPCGFELRPKSVQSESLLM